MVLLAHNIKVKHVTQHAVQRLVRVLGHVFDNVDELTQREGVRHQAVVERLTQLSKHGNEPLQSSPEDTRSSLRNKLELGFRVRVVHGVGRKDVADLGVEIVAQERVSGSVGQQNQPEIRVHRNIPFVARSSRLCAGRPDLTTVRQVHFAIFRKRLEHRGNVNRRLVRLVDNQHTSHLDRTDERRVLVENDTVLDRRLHHERLNRRVTVQLDVLARPVDQLQEPVREPVLPDTLVSDE